MLKFKKDKMLNSWVAETNEYEYEIVKDLCDGL